MQNGYVVNFTDSGPEEILLRNLRDDSLGYTELAGVITGLTQRPWNTEDIAEEVKIIGKLNQTETVEKLF